MKIDIQTLELSNGQREVSRATLLPSSEEGLFKIDQHNVVPGQYDGRTVSRIGFFGLDDAIIEQIKAGDVDLSDVLQEDPRTGFMVSVLESVHLVAEVEAGETTRDGIWRAIASFREYEPVVNATA